MVEGLIPLFRTTVLLPEMKDMELVDLGRGGPYSAASQQLSMLCWCSDFYKPDGPGGQDYKSG